MTPTAKQRILRDDPDLRTAYEDSAPKRELAMALRALRARAGLTQVALAERSGLRQSQISRLESPDGPLPETETVRRYAAACDARLRMDFVALGSPAASGESDGELAVAYL